MDYYEILQVPKTATAFEIKSAYRQLVKKYHPDLNKDPEAQHLIRQITEAYEVLSNPYSRNLMALRDEFSGVQSEQESEEARYKREYREKKVREEREHIDYLITLKIRFYRWERWANILFLAMGIVFTIDYFSLSATYAVPLMDISRSGYDESTITTPEGVFRTSEELYDFLQNHPSNTVTLLYSSVFNYPVQLELSNSTGMVQFKISDTLHSFNNAFAYVIVLIGLTLGFRRNYDDWTLTLGIIPFFLVSFLLLFMASKGCF